MENQTTQNPPLSEDTKSIITVLVLLTLPPIGVVIMWVWTKWKLWMKALITGCTCLPLVLIFFFLLFVIVFGDDSNRVTQAENSRIQSQTVDYPGKVTINNSTSNSISNNFVSYSDTSGGYKVSYSGDDLKNCNEMSYSAKLILYKAPFTCSGASDAPYLIRVSTEPLNADYFGDPKRLLTNEIVIDGAKGTSYTYTFNEEDGPLMSIGKQGVIVLENPYKENKFVVIEMYGDDPMDQVIFTKFLASFEWLENK